VTTQICRPGRMVAGLAWAAQRAGGVATSWAYCSGLPWCWCQLLQLRLLPGSDDQ
jgi:hypothetical protein